MAKKPENQSCKTCRYFAERPRSIAGVRYAGSCRRGPPSVLDEDYDAEFPTVNEETWCGEYAPADPETFTDGEVTLARLVLLGDRTAARALADKLRE